MSSACTVAASDGEPPASVLTPEQLVAFLRTVTGGNSSFARSLVRYAEAYGALTETQCSYGHRIYDEWRDAVARERAVSATVFVSMHAWVYCGTVDHSGGGNHLGTYCYSDFHRCNKCGVIGEVFYRNNYLGY